MTAPPAVTCTGFGVNAPLPDEPTIEIVVEAGEGLGAGAGLVDGVGEGLGAGAGDTVFDGDGVLGVE